jgi:hypothetical protein
MKKMLYVGALLFGPAFAQLTLADTLYDITLIDVTTSLVDGTGTFTYGSGTFSGFTVTLASNSETFDLTAIANSYGSNTHGCDGGASISVITFLLNTNCQEGGPFPVSWGTASGNPDTFSFSPDSNQIAAQGPDSGIRVQEGTFTVTAQNSVPEPATVILMPTALLAIAFVVRQRIAWSKSPASRM